MPCSCSEASEIELRRTSWEVRLHLIQMIRRCSTQLRDLIWNLSIGMTSVMCAFTPVAAPTNLRNDSVHELTLPATTSYLRMGCTNPTLRRVGYCSLMSWRTSCSSREAREAPAAR